MPSLTRSLDLMPAMVCGAEYEASGKVSRLEHFGPVLVLAWLIDLFSRALLYTRPLSPHSTTRHSATHRHTLTLAHLHTHSTSLSVLYVCPWFAKETS